jgi:hypothetical protein
MIRPILILILVGVLACGALGTTYFFVMHERGSAASAADPLANLPASAAELRSLTTHWEKRIQEIGGSAAYAEFLAGAASSSIDTHSQAHAFGEALYKEEGLQALRVCDSSFEFGCYHSFLAVAVNEEGIESLPKLSEACKDDQGVMDLRCQHGLGHGVLVYTGYGKLGDALALCESVSTRATGGCYSGVFMEYNFHTMEFGNYVRDGSGDLYAPCDTLPEKFQPSCYYEQVQWWQNLFQNDFKHIGTLCGEVSDPASRDACFEGTGNYIATFARLSYNDIIRLCADMPDQDTVAICHEGANGLLRVQPELLEEAENLCTILPEPYQEECLERLRS